MRILFVTNRFPTAKTPADSPCIAQQETALKKLGHEIEILYIDSQSSKSNYLSAAAQVFNRNQIHRRYDLVHAHYGHYCGVAACFQTRVPFVLTLRGSDLMNERERKISRLALKRADHVIVMSQEMQKMIDRDDVSVIPYGVDLHAFKPTSMEHARRELELPGDAKIALFPYDPERTVKRFDLFQQALQIAKDSWPELESVVVHAIPYTSMSKYMNAADVLVLTSDREGAPVAVREAMACNLPIVSVDVGDVSEIIENTPGCFLAERNPADIARKISEVLASGSRTDGRRSMEKMSVSFAAQEVEKVYEQLVIS